MAPIPSPPRTQAKKSSSEGELGVSLECYNNPAPFGDWTLSTLRIISESLTGFAMCQHRLHSQVPVSSNTRSLKNNTPSPPPPMTHHVILMAHGFKSGQWNYFSPSISMLPMTLGAKSNTYENHMCQMHMVCRWNKCHRATFDRQRAALLHALCSCAGEQSMYQKVAFESQRQPCACASSADHMHLTHMKIICVSDCPQCELFSL
jgi:hypothetical protein